MAENLGKIDIGVTIEKPTGGGGTGGTGGGGGGAGGGSAEDPRLGEVIRGFSKGGALGGARAIGFVKLAAKAALVIGAFVILKKVIGSVVGIFVKWSKQIDATIEKFSSLNATMASASAQRRISELVRNIKSAQILAGPMSVASRQKTTLSNIMRPLMDLLDLVKTFFVTLIQPVLILFAEGLRDATIWVLQLGVTFGIVGDALIDLVIGLQNILSLGIYSKQFKYTGQMIKAGLSPHFEELQKRMDKLLEELKRGNDDNAEIEINKIMGSVGVALTQGRWDPWRDQANETPWPEKTNNGGGK